MTPKISSLALLETQFENPSSGTASGLSYKAMLAAVQNPSLLEVGEGRGPFVCCHVRYLLAVTKINEFSL